MNYFSTKSRKSPGSKTLQTYKYFGIVLSVRKGQSISKADWRAINSPKKRTDEFVLFAFLLFTANRSNSSVRFLGESMARQSAFWFYLTLNLDLK